MTMRNTTESSGKSKGSAKPSKSRLRQNKAKKRDSLSKLSSESGVGDSSYLKGKKF